MSREYRDPDTGDQIRRSEFVSFRIQNLIRRWPFILLYTGVTFTVWVVGSPAVLGWWNYTASYLAILVESIVGIGVYQMSRRDSVILREIRQVTDATRENTASVQQLAEMVLQELRNQEK